MFALMADLTDRLVVVVGGGPVGRRKARRLLESGAIVRLVCLEPRPADFAFTRLVWLCEPYQADHLAGATLVFAAAPPEVNRRVAADARRRGILVNRADDPALGDFVVPAMHREGDLILAVSTGGAAPTLAKRIRDRLADQIDPALGEWVALLRELRPQIAEQFPDPARRREIYERLAETRWLEALHTQGPAAVRRAMWEEVRREADPPLK